MKKNKFIINVRNAFLQLFLQDVKKEEDVKKDETPKPQVSVEKINNSLTQKVTGTRCPPCGSLGLVNDG
jgi:hypothetical protein